MSKRSRDGSDGIEQADSKRQRVVSVASNGSVKAIVGTSKDLMADILLMQDRTLLETLGGRVVDEFEVIGKRQDSVIRRFTQKYVPKALSGLIRSPFMHHRIFLILFGMVCSERFRGTILACMPLERQRPFMQLLLDCYDMFIHARTREPPTNPSRPYDDLIYVFLGWKAMPVRTIVRRIPLSDPLWFPTAIDFVDGVATAYLLA